MSETSPQVNKVLVAVVLALFVALNGYAFVVDDQLMGLINAVRSMRGWTLVLGCDLLISLTLVGTWLFRDAKKTGVSPVPYLALTATTGSIGPLVYLLKRK